MTSPPVSGTSVGNRGTWFSIWHLVVGTSVENSARWRVFLPSGRVAEGSYEDVDELIMALASVAKTDDFKVWMDRKRCMELSGAERTPESVNSGGSVVTELSGAERTPESGH